MRKLTVNKGNWSGEEITVNVRKDNSFKLFDYDFKLSAKYDEELGCTFYEVTSSSWDHALVTGYKDENGMCFMSSSGVSREAKDPFEAAIQVLSNIL